MEPEILNLEYHYAQLATIALTKYRNNGKAAAALGISLRTLFRWKRRFNIEYIIKEVNGKSTNKFIPKSYLRYYSATWRGITVDGQRAEVRTQINRKAPVGVS